MNRKFITQPRMSVTKLGEYLSGAKPGRRKTIIKDQRERNPFKGPRYRDAEQTIKDFLTMPNPDLSRLRQALALFSQKEQIAKAQKKKWHTVTANVCASAVSHFMEISDDIQLDGVGIVAGSNNVPKLHIAGVDISVRPDIILTDPDNGNIVGGIKLYLNKTYPLTDDAFDYVGTVLYRYLCEKMSTESTVDHKKCFVVDVFAHRIIQAPKAFKRNMGHVEAACSEIASVWHAA
ncbi:hypothetical protein [Maridesulfovibrio sp.]|uniref:hypothetical protein n=1 Tax=Maridesulfovibrio sp. TaxID=2795000 RepID=UPI0029CA5C2D|nr:hypothetical protein [Maridesulfovibrio sp.]